MGVPHLQVLNLRRCTDFSSGQTIGSVSWHYDDRALLGGIGFGKHEMQLSQASEPGIAWHHFSEGAGTQMVHVVIS